MRFSNFRTEGPDPLSPSKRLLRKIIRHKINRVRIQSREEIERKVRSDVRSLDEHYSGGELTDATVCDILTASELALLAS